MRGTIPESSGQLQRLERAPRVRNAVAPSWGLLTIIMTALFSFASGAADDPAAVASIRNRFEEWRYAEAETEARALVASAEFRHGVDSFEAARAIDLLLEALWREVEAERAHTRIINDGVEGEVDHGGTWNPVSRGEAEHLAERALAIKRASLGEEHAEVADTLDHYGRLLSSFGDSVRARDLHERAVAVHRGARGADNRAVARSLGYLALARRRAGDHEGARRLYEEQLAIRERAVERAPVELAQSLNNLAAIVEDVGDYDSARRFLERAVGTLRQGEAGQALAAALRNLAMLLVHTLDLAEVSPLAEEALAIQERADPHHPRMVGLLILAAWSRAMAGDLAAGRRLLERSVSLSREIRPDHPLHAQALTNLAELQSAFAEYPDAIRTQRQALAIKERFYTPDHVELATSIAPLGDALYRSGDATSAKEHFARTLSAYEQSAATSDNSLLFYLNVYANVLRDTGEHERARGLYSRLLANMERVFGPDHPGVASVLREMVLLDFETGDARQALAAALRAERIGRNHLRRTSRGLSERQALLYAQQRVTGLDLALSLVDRTADLDARREVADSVIRSRALVLDEMAARHRSYGASPRAAELAGRLAAVSRRLSNLFVRGPSADAPEHYRGLLGATLAEREQIELDLAAESAVFQEQRKQDELGLSDVARALPPGSAVVSYVYYLRHEAAPAPGAEIAPVSDGPVPEYLALVLRSGSEVPQIVRLGEASGIDARVERWRREIATPTGAATDRESGALLREAVWDPLRAKLGDTANVFVVPDGSLNLVSLAALPVGERDYLIESRPVIHYMSAERDLVRGDAASGSGLLAIGGPSFDETSPFESLAPRTADAPLATAATTATYRGQSSACSDFRSLRFEPLPASAVEAREIVALWASAASAADRIDLLGPAATEAAFKLRAPGRQVLHVATHGFFLGSCPPAVYTSRGIGKLVAEEDMQNDESEGEGENPLLLAGLVLSGANRRDTAGPDEEDGILTAEEIAALDLSGIEWAVLSACDTGLGDVRASEGVFGLRRAFRVAGASTLIMSLWPVEDESARAWMRALYEARLTRRRTTAESVREASLEVLRARREKELPVHPFFWAGFVAAGEWR